MSSFSADWLALREPVDHRSRNHELGQALTDRFQARDAIRVIDLGCGTGSNLRATASLLPPRQHWMLVDNDPALLAAAQTALAGWADRSASAAGGLTLEKDGREIIVELRQANLARDLDNVLRHGPNLVTASALFDLCSVAFIKSFVGTLARLRAAFYTVLTYNGIQRWTPRHPSDGAMIAAFHAHQMTDKGFGASAGPTATAQLADALRLADYTVLEGDSPWLLGPRDQRLVADLATGFAAAVRETGKVDAKDVDTWTRVVRRGAEVGHTDTLAFPA